MYHGYRLDRFVGSPRLALWLAVFVVAWLSLVARPAAAASASGPVDALRPASPAVEADKQASADQVRVGDAYTYAIHITATVVISPVNAIMTDTLPAAVSLISGTLQASHGTPASTDNTVTWSGVLSPNEPVSITFQVRAVQGGVSADNSAQVDAGEHGQFSTPAVSTTVDPAQLFFPFVGTVGANIYGAVRNQGVPAAGVFLELRRYDGGNWTTQTSTTTKADGSFSFKNMPNLSPGQRYYVRYLAPTGSSGNVYLWFTRVLRTYAGETVFIGGFDIADIPIVSPPNDSTVGLPHTFRWLRRTATPTDSYEFELADPAGGLPSFYSQPLLGYVDSYTLAGLPPGFVNDVYYGWAVWVYSPDEGIGRTRRGNWVRFSASRVSAAAEMMALPPNQWAIPEDPPIR